MPTPKRETSPETYECSKMPLTTVRITREFKIEIRRDSATGNSDQIKIPDGFDCDHKTECGVEEKIGASRENTQCDWSKCVHPVMSKISQ